MPRVLFGGGRAAVLAASCVAVLAGCQSTSGATAGGGGGSSPASSASSTARPSGYGAVFLGIDECSSFGTTSFTEVACSSERAAARVVARHDGRPADGPLCPATTDFVLHISAQRPSPTEKGDGAVELGYACMRNLQPPHPGDPGGGGGPRTIVGDCVHEAADGQVRETSCAATGDDAPEYRVTEAVRERAGCPAATALYVRLGGARPVGCALPL